MEEWWDLHIEYPKMDLETLLVGRNGITYVYVEYNNEIN